MELHQITPPHGVTSLFYDIWISAQHLKDVLKPLTTFGKPKAKYLMRNTHHRKHLISEDISKSREAADATRTKGHKSRQLRTSKFKVGRDISNGNTRHGNTQGTVEKHHNHKAIRILKSLIALLAFRLSYSLAVSQ